MMDQVNIEDFRENSLARIDKKQKTGKQKYGWKKKQLKFSVWTFV